MNTTKIPDPAGAAKRDGMRRADQGASAAWVREADQAILRLAKTRASFTADEVWRILGTGPRDKVSGQSTRDGRALGPRMLSAARAGWIRKGGTVLTVRESRESRHQAPIQVWVSLLRASVVGEAQKPDWAYDLAKMTKDDSYNLLRALGLLDHEGSFAW